VPPTLGDRLAHILDAILSIDELLEGKSLADVTNNRHTRVALERELEIISEASRKLPADTKSAQRGIDWTGMAALGNRLRHAYHLIDLEIVLQIVESDLPPLKAFIEQVLDEERKQ
jgi:uncharacterized protein with HEPN domain